MADVVEYIIRLKDQISGTLAAIRGNTEGMNRSMERSSNIVNQLRNNLLGFYSIQQGFRLVGDIVDTTAKMETLNNVINYTSIDAKDAVANHTFLHDIVHRLKLPIMETTEAFSSLSASMLGSKLQGEQMRNIFEGVSTGVTGMHLNAQQAQSVFLALTQIMSKGKLQAQELTLQLGQALPGAQRIAAESMGMTTAELLKQMEVGKISAEVFLPKFAAQLKKNFAGAIPNAVNSIQAMKNEMSTVFIELKDELGKSFYPIIIQVLRKIIEIIPRIKEFGAYIRDTIVPTLQKWMHWGMEIARWIKDHWLFVKVILDIVVAYTAVVKVINLAKAAQIAFIAVANLNPFVLAIAGALTLLKILKDIYETQRATGEKVKEDANSGYKKHLETWMSAYQKAGMNIKVAKEKLNSDETKILRGQLADAEKSLRANNNPETRKKYAEAQERIYALHQWASQAFNSTNPQEKMKEAGDVKGAKDIIGDPATSKIDDSTSKVTGTKNTVINIDIKQLVGSIENHVTNLSESTAKIREEVVKALITAVNDSQIVAGG